MTTIDNTLEIKTFDDFDILLVHQDYLKDESSKNFLQTIEKIKILARNSQKSKRTLFYDELKLPTSIKEINQIVENSIAKKNFITNSSIKIKDYILDKNEKKLIKKMDFISLTEKEIQLLELLVKSKEAISKKKILEEVWKYAAEADTHTVETHIYRLRKKIEEKFSDKNLIINNKNGYLF